MAAILFVRQDLCIVLVAWFQLSVADSRCTQAQYMCMIGRRRDPTEGPRDSDRLGESFTV